MSDVHSAISPKPDVYFQLIKGLAYFLLLIVTEVAAVNVLAIYYAFRMTKNLPSGTETNFAQISADALEVALANVNARLIIYAFILIIVLFLFFALRKKNFREETRFKKFSVKYLPAMALLTFGFYFLVTAILNLLPDSFMESYSESSSFIIEGSFVFSIIAQGLVAPLTEELIFRGLMLSRFDRALPKWIGILISSLLFGIAHGDSIWFAYAAVLGCIFCIVAELTGSIFSTYLMHCAFNGIGTILAYYYPDIDRFEMNLFLLISIPMIAAGIFLLHRTHKAAKIIKE